MSSVIALANYYLSRVSLPICIRQIVKFDSRGIKKDEFDDFLVIQGIYIYISRSELLSERANLCQAHVSKKIKRAL